MSLSYLVSIDLNKNEIQNVVVHPLATAPLTPNEGQMYFNTASDTLFMFINSAWQDITGRVVSITSSTAALTVDNTDPTAPAISIADADGTNSGLLSSAFFTDLTNATSANTANTIVERDGGGNFAANDITASSVTGLSAPVNPSDAANKSYVDSLVSSGMKIKNAIDASTNPNYPAAVVGDAYYVSVAGKIGGASGDNVDVKDLAVCIVDTAAGDQAAVGANWFILQENLEQATEVVAGYSRKATSAEAITGTEADAYITPATLAAVTAGFGSGTTGKFVATVGDAVNLSYAVNHALGEQYVHVQVYDTVSNEEVITEVVLTDANNCSVVFAVAPSANQYRVIVIG